MSVSQYQRPTLLIFTNSSHTLYFFTGLFDEDYNIIECDTIPMLKEIIDTAKVDIIFLQESSTEESIQQVCHEIRTLPSAHKLPIFVITTHLKRSYIKTLRQAGASGFILEPLDEKDVLQKIQQAQSESQTKAKTTSLITKIQPVIPTGEVEVLKKVTPHLTPVKETNYNVLALQIDNFHTIAHMTEESFLSGFIDHFQNALKEELRPQDDIKEIEKGKYLILLPKTTKRAAMLIAQNIKETLDEFSVTTKAGKQPITVSIAFSSETFESKASEGQLGKMIELSKKKLEQAKDDGDRIIFY